MLNRTTYLKMEPQRPREGFWRRLWRRIGGQNFWGGEQ